MAGLWLAAWLMPAAVAAGLASGYDTDLLGIDGLIEAIFDQTRQRGFDLNHDRGVSAADVTVLIELNQHR